jgi:hypothetical protein
MPIFDRLFPIFLTLLFYYLFFNKYGVYEVFIFADYHKSDFIY